MEHIEIPNFEEPGIYALFNHKEKSVYIGKCQNMKEQAIKLRSTLKRGTHTNKDIQEAYDQGDVLRFYPLQYVFNDEDYEEDEQEIKITALYYLYLAYFKIDGFKLYNKQLPSNLGGSALYEVMRLFDFDTRVNICFEDLYDEDYISYKKLRSRKNI